MICSNIISQNLTKNTNILSKSHVALRILKRDDYEKRNKISERQIMMLTKATVSTIIPIMHFVVIITNESNLLVLSGDAI